MELEKNKQNNQIVQIQQREEKLGQHLLKPIIRIEYLVWGTQLIIWNLIVVVSKIFLYVIQFKLSSVLQLAGDFLFDWLNGMPNLKLIIVMVFVPLILNGIQFWIQDNFLKKNDIQKSEII